MNKEKIYGFFGFNYTRMTKNEKIVFWAIPILIVVAFIGIPIAYYLTVTVGTNNW